MFFFVVVVVLLFFFIHCIFFLVCVNQLREELSLLKFTWYDLLIIITGFFPLILR